ncbi:MAG TPA: glycosyltransferase family 39 protein [Pyrinomonadaceae bacterium]
MSKQQIKPSVESDQLRQAQSSQSSPSRTRQLIINSFIIFLIAFGIRLLALQDNRHEALKVQTAVTEGYRHTGRLLREGGISSFLSSSSPLADPNHLGHPPGYSILMATVSGFTSDTDAAVQLIQITADALAAVLIFLIACALFSTSIASIAGLLVAFAPQFTYNSTLLLPDTLAVVPLLLSVYCLAQAARHTRLALFIAAGALVGVSCWLRANAMMLAPFMALALALLFERGRRVRYALLLIGGMLLVVAPLTIRNYIVYDHFIPVSLGAGQTLLEGIADYDQAGRFGIPATDMGIMKMEAEAYGRADYYGTLFNPDGIKRERLRLKQGFGVISSHPFWFAGVMARRAAGMLRLERVKTISQSPPVTHSLLITDETAPAWSASPTDLLINGTINSTRAEISLTPDVQMLSIKGDDSKYESQFSTAFINVQQNTDYLLRLPVRIEQGRLTINVAGTNGSTPRASAIVEIQDWKTPAEQPLQMIQIPFSSRSDEQVRIAFANGGPRPSVQIGQPQLYALGPTTHLWTRYPRTLINVVQKLFITAVMLPFALFGLFLLVRRRHYQTLVLLLVVPAYYLCFQSALHTEYRYVLAIHYFLFVLVALALHTIGKALWENLRKLSIARRLFHRPSASAA